MAAAMEAWALPRLQQLLPLDDDSLKQILQYAESLPKDAAAEHLKNLLGDEPRSLEFISSFNMRRQNAPSAKPQPSNSSNGQSSPQPGAMPRGGGSRGGRGGKKRANIHALPPRQLEGQGQVGGAYLKHDEDDYIPRAERSRQMHKEQMADNLAIREKAPDATQMPLITDDATPTTKPVTSKMPPSAAGLLVSDSLSTRKGASSQSSRTASPAPKTKINITGGTAMHGASTALSDLDSAIRSLEVQTNPSLSMSAVETERRKCNCMATRHPLLDIAPNCLNCGKIICVKQGLGPCTHCGAPLLSSEEIGKVLRVLKDERGDERQKVNNATHKKADVALGKARAFTGRDFLAQASTSTSASPLSSAGPSTPVESEDEASNKAKAHRDKLLNYQANNARRTRIHDEAADYDIPTAGTNMWASPAERAQQLKRQQKMLRENEWNARPEYEKRRVVASINVVGGKVVRRMAEVERPDFSQNSQDGAEENDDYQIPATAAGRGDGGGAFSRNPLAAGLIRPLARVEEGKAVVREKETMWRRVQMDGDADNEGWILDGGVYGERGTEDRVLGEEEHAQG
ncbi:hypothetical protein LTR62_001818 [Meristemomyces frigidus]|uniref:TRIP4/RQT4 C2HC5-type zinc finger domain-containing protein n=1 Tax=Meristemomyces frigidus TaxID=1508187 RepID=A0AAN7TLM4_9PEZI|nr:hypothetical protein LTR62_001818 [Meristemomyces frigidus]